MKIIKAGDVKQRRQEKKGSDSDKKKRSNCKEEPTKKE
jgi:hypothetical protein